MPRKSRPRSTCRALAECLPGPQRFHRKRMFRPISPLPPRTNVSGECGESHSCLFTACVLASAAWALHARALASPPPHASRAARLRNEQALLTALPQVPPPTTSTLSATSCGGARARKHAKRRASRWRSWIVAPSVCSSFCLASRAKTATEATAARFFYNPRPNRGGRRIRRRCRECQV